MSGGAIVSALVDLALSITDEQIKTLLTESGAAGDRIQVAVCHVALGHDSDDAAQCIAEHRRFLERIGIIPEHIDADVHARAECARAIRAADAQS